MPVQAQLSLHKVLACYLWQRPGYKQMFLRLDFEEEKEEAYNAAPLPMNQFAVRDDKFILWEMEATVHITTYLQTCSAEINLTYLDDEARGVS